jgi:hypothetical protein
MRRKREYDLSVRRSNRATGAGFALVLSAIGFLGLMLSVAASAQINGMPASVTSPGFGGRQINGVRPSVTSLGPRGFTPNSPVCCFTGTSLGRPPHVEVNPDTRNNSHPRRHDGLRPWGGVIYTTPYYGYYDSGNDAANDSPGDSYNGGPTIFDRRGSGTPPPAPAPYPSRARPDNAPVEASSDPAAQPEATASDQPQTVLVFKDGHQVEVANYAIVGSTLYDLSGGRRQKIALADLDLTATAKQNDDRGIDFRVPGASEAN